MGDISEMRGIIVVMTFLIIFVVLASTAPSAFNSPVTATRTASVPSYFSAFDLNIYAQVYNGTVPHNIPSNVQWTLAGRDWIFNAYPGDVLQLGIKGYWWIFWVATDYVSWKDYQGVDRSQGPNHIDLSISTLDSLYNSSDPRTLKFRCSVDKDPSMGCDIIFGFNNVLYATPSIAWSHGALYFLQGIGFDQVNTTTNAWNIIGMLIFFQLPNVHPVIQAFLAVPIYACIAYLAYILILRALGAIFGGGGA